MEDEDISGFRYVAWKQLSSSTAMNVVIIIMLTSGLCSAVQLVSWVKPRASQMVAASSRVQAGAQ